MAKLSQFRQDSRAIEEGEWVTVDAAEYGDLQIHARGLTDRYFDAQARRLRSAATSVGGDVNKLPSALRRKISIDCLVEHVLVSPPVRNLFHDDGREVGEDEFFEMLRHPDFRKLTDACFLVASQVGQRIADDVMEAVGNFEPSSDGNSTEKA